MRKGIIEYTCLLILSKQKVYPSELIRILEHAHFVIKEATVYTVLNRLRKEGKVDYEWRESTMGPPRKYFFITDSGMEALSLCAETWNELSGAINIINAYNPTTNNDETNE